ncbi:hypothetical protein BpHYR1_040146, partial [Brachionus plicatilis]
FKRSESESCSGSNPACQNYAGLTCTTATCRCSSTQYWVANKCLIASLKNVYEKFGIKMFYLPFFSPKTGSVSKQPHATKKFKKVENYVGINQYCDGTTYRCKSGLTCQGSAAGNYICQCGAGTYWTGTSCASVRTYGQTCDGLKCWAYTNGYSCYADFGDGKRCLCETVTQWWTGSTCVAKYFNFVSCSSSCQCREDLGLACRSYSGFYSCNTYFADTRCTCVNSAFWTGSTCVTRYSHYVTCTDSCQCQMNLGLRCETQNNNCYSYAGRRCVCQSDQYWDGSLCRNKKNGGDGCSSDCQFK